MTTSSSGKGGLYDNQPTDVVVHVAPGHARSTTREATKDSQREQWQGMPGGGKWATVIGTDSGRGSMGPEAPVDKRQAKDISGILALAKKWLPVLFGVASISGILKKASSLGQSLGAIFDMLGMIVDAILMPFLLPVLLALGPMISPLLDWLLQDAKAKKDSDERSKWMLGGGLLFGAAALILGAPLLPAVGVGILAAYGASKVYQSLKNEPLTVAQEKWYQDYGPTDSVTVMNKNTPGFWDPNNPTGVRVFDKTIDIDVNNDAEASVLEETIVGKLQTPYAPYPGLR